MRRLTALLALVALTGCARVNSIEQPDGSVDVHDRLEIILSAGAAQLTAAGGADGVDSDVKRDIMLAIISGTFQTASALLERENQKGTNVTSAWRDLFQWIATGAVAARAIAN